MPLKKKTYLTKYFLTFFTIFKNFFKNIFRNFFKNIFENYFTHLTLNQLLKVFNSPKKLFKLPAYFVYPLLLLLIFMIIKHPLTFDATKLKNNSLNESSIALLSKLDKELQIKLVTGDADKRARVQTIISLFQKENKHVKFQVSTDYLSPQEKKALNLQSNHNLLLTLEDQTKALDLDKLIFNEQMLTQVLYQMLRHKEDWIVFLSGHGELDPLGKENWQIGQLNKTLKNTGINVSTLRFNDNNFIPDNTQVLVIADNQKPLLPKEVENILHYVKQGGNLLWLVNPGSHPHLEPLAKLLGIHWQEGVILDPKAHELGTAHPAVNVIMDYPEHAITKGLNTLTIFPWTRPIDFAKSENLGWDAKPLLITKGSTQLKKEHIETLKGKRRSKAEGEGRGKGEEKGKGEGKTKETVKGAAGPFTIGLTLERGKQRVVVIGNSHFLNNSTIHNHGNLLLAKNIFNWLSEADFLMDNQIPPKVAEDIFFFDTPFVHFTRLFVFPYLLPLIYLLVGWQLRRQRYRLV